MAVNMLYGGDEIGALVFDPGSNSFRVGYAQEDTPKADIPSVVGVAPDMPGLNPEEKMPNNNINQSTNWKYYIDTINLFNPHQGMEVNGFMEKGMIGNWDLFEKMLDFSYKRVIQSESEYHPVLFSESPWNVKSEREKLVELMFEKYRVPAFFLMKNAVLAAFANGRSTALVIDSGATHTTAVPVVDGHVLTQAIVKSPIGGDVIIKHVRTMLEKSGIDLTPASLIATKETVRDREKPKYTRKQFSFQPTGSWLNYMVDRSLQDFQHSVIHVSEAPYDERTAATIPAVTYEFPTGYHQEFGPERFQLAECIFDHSVLGAGQIAATSAGMCEVDLRPALYGSVVLTGGNTLLQGFSDRLARDLQLRTPNSIRLKLIASNGTVERKYGSWIGGSILASIGTFQQLWFSMQEYKESGKAQIDRKCP